MTPPECLNAAPTSIHPSPRRAPARNAEVRSDLDHDRDYAHPNIQNGSAFTHETEVRGSRTSAPELCATLQTICRPLKSHR